MTTLRKVKQMQTGWNFDNSYTHLPGLFFSRQNPVPVRSPKLIMLNRPLAASLGLDPDALQDEAAMLSGNRTHETSVPIAQAYAGHQFGYFTMLGDGRAILLGEQITPSAERYDIQLKGAGRTPYSRGGDGRAVLGPMLREYIISEAMHALGIPTTRSLAVVTTGETVYRDMPQTGAILVRTAASHLRVGTFQYAAKWGSIDDLRLLADYTLQRHFPNTKRDENRYMSLLKEVIKRQAYLIAKWQLVGFIHGVMNTDNMALSGETIDYGPCAFMNDYDPATVFSSIDRQGRYAYGNQPPIAKWNLMRFAEALLPLLSSEQNKAVKIAEDVISDYDAQYNRHWLNGMREKLGIFNEEAEDKTLIDTLLDIIYRYHADFTNTFHALTFDRREDAALFASREFQEWNTLWQKRLERQENPKPSSQQLMRSANPALIPRNHRVEEALKAAEDGDFSYMNRFLNALERPFAHTSKQAEYAEPPGPSACGYRTFCGT